MIRFWNTSATMIIGMVTTTQAAVMLPIGRWKSTAPVNWEIATGTVWATSGSRGAKVLASRNSFQAETKMMIAAANTPGAASGGITRKNALNGVAPSTLAASSSSFGIAAKNVVRMKIVNGRVNDVYGMYSPSYVLSRPSFSHSS